MSGTQPPPRFHIDQPQTLSGDVTHADLGRVFDRQTHKVGRAGWDGRCALIVFMPDQIQPHLTATLNPFDSSITPTGVGIASGVGRFIPLDHPDLYPLIGTAIQHTAFGKLDAIKRARVVFDLGLAEAKALIESALNEGAERGPITGVTLKDGRTVVMRQQDDDEAKERERKSMEELRALDDLRAQDMDGAFKFRGANLRSGSALHVVTGNTDKPKSRIIGADDFKDAVMDWSLDPTAEKYEKLRQAELATDPPNPREARSDTFIDAFCPLEAVLSNLGLAEQYQSTLLANLDKHQPEIYAAITVLRSKLVRDEDQTATPAS